MAPPERSRQGVDETPREELLRQGAGRARHPRAPSSPAASAMYHLLPQEGSLQRSQGRWAGDGVGVGLEDREPPRGFRASLPPRLPALQAKGVAAKAKSLGRSRWISSTRPRRSSWSPNCGTPGTNATRAVRLGPASCLARMRRWSSAWSSASAFLDRVRLDWPGVSRPGLLSERQRQPAIARNRAGDCPLAEPSLNWNCGIRIARSVSRPWSDISWCHSMGRGPLFCLVVRRGETEELLGRRLGPQAPERQ